MYNGLRSQKLRDPKLQETQLPLQAAKLTERLRGSLRDLFTFRTDEDGTVLNQGSIQDDTTLLRGVQDMFLTALTFRLDLSLKRCVPELSWPAFGEKFDKEKMIGVGLGYSTSQNLGVKCTLLPLVSRQASTEQKVLSKALVLVGHHTNFIA